MSDFLVKVEHLHMLRSRNGGGFCVRNSRIWATAHGLDFKDFVRNGILASRLLATGDELAAELVEVARKEQSNGQG